MTLPAATITRLEKAAVDNGFDIDLGRVGEWLYFGSSQTTMRIWLSAIGETVVLVGTSRSDVLDALTGIGSAVTDLVPTGAAGARSLMDIPALHRLLRRAFQLSRTLPDEIYRVFQAQTLNLPRSTDAERLVIQRVGQDIFRRGQLEFWDGRCAITGLAVPDLLRASHIKPWADCEHDTERLDVFNGLLLSPNFDAAFDAGFITVSEGGLVVVSPALPRNALPVLGLEHPLKVNGLQNAHECYLPWHRDKVFRA